jgi:hypothetical protein
MTIRLTQLLLFSLLTACESHDYSVVYDYEYLKQIEEGLEQNNISYELTGNTFKYSSNDSDRVRNILDSIYNRTIRMQFFDLDHATIVTDQWTEDNVKYQKFIAKDASHIFLVDKADCKASLKGLDKAGLSTKGVCD